MNNDRILAAYARLCAAGSCLRWTAVAEQELSLSASVAFSLLRELGTGGVYANFPAGSPLQQSFDRGGDGEVPAGTALHLRVPRLPESLAIARDLTDLLSLPGAAEGEPGAYILCADQQRATGVLCFCSNQEGTEAPAEVRRYHDAVRLWCVLQRQAEHVDVTTNALLFFGIRRTEILPGFEPTDLLAPVVVGEIAEFIQSPDSSRIRKQIFISALSEFLRDQNYGSAFRYLLRTSEHFARRLREGLAVHLAEYSPEKLALEGQKSAFDLSEKLEKVIGGLETKSLTIPVALLFAVKDIETGAGWTTINGLLLLSVVLFALTMSLVHCSQLAILRTLKISLDDTEASLIRRGLEERNPVLSGTFRNLKSRWHAAWVASWVMCIAAWIPVVAVVTVVFFSQPKTMATVTGDQPTVAARNDSAMAEQATATK